MNKKIKPFPNRKYSFKDGYIIFYDNDNLTITLGDGKSSDGTLYNYDHSTTADGGLCNEHGTTDGPNIIYDYLMNFHRLNKQYKIKFTDMGEFTASVYNNKDEKCVLLDKLNYLLLKNKYSWITSDKEGNVTEQGNVFFNKDCYLNFVDNNNNVFSGSYHRISDKEYNVNFNNKKYKIYMKDKEEFYIDDNDVQVGNGVRHGPF